MDANVNGQAQVPPEVSAELAQVLSNLVLGDNEVRRGAESLVNARLAHTPDVYLLALAQFAVGAQEGVMRSFALVLLRRLLFRPQPTQNQASSNAPTLPLYDTLPPATLSTLEGLLLSSLLHEPEAGVRRKSVDAVCAVADAGMRCGRMWHALQEGVWGLVRGTNGQPSSEADRETAYRVFAASPLLVADLDATNVGALFRAGLEDTHLVGVVLSALQASVRYLEAGGGNGAGGGLVGAMLETLPRAMSAPTQGSTTTLETTTALISALTPLATSRPTLFAPHLPALLSFLPGVILPQADCGPTPRAGVPPFAFGGGQSTQDSIQADSQSSNDDQEEDRTALRLAALELMVSLTEARPGMVRAVPGWVALGVRASLEGMGEWDEEGAGGETTLEEWRAEDPSHASSDDAAPTLYEQSLDRFACALTSGPTQVPGDTVLSTSFTYIPALLLAYDWRARHAGLLAIGALAEGAGAEMGREVGRVIGLVLPAFRDPHPRVRWAACQCIGQLCTDLADHGVPLPCHDLLNALIPALEDPETRVHSHAAAALINFCEGVEHDVLLPYLDPVVERLIRLLTGPGPSYVHEQAITTLAMVADAGEVAFGKHYATVMPLLLTLLRHAEAPPRMRGKAMECAGLVAIAVGEDIFRSNAHEVVQLLLNPPVPQHSGSETYLLSTWAKLCQALGPSFAPYLPSVVPGLLGVAGRKADVRIGEESDPDVVEEDGVEDEDGWSSLGGIKVRTAGLEEKCAALETLVVFASTLGGAYAPYAPATLSVALSGLKFSFHDGVREASAMLLAPLVHCLVMDPQTQVAPLMDRTFLSLVDALTAETDPAFVGSLCRALGDCLRVVGSGGGASQVLQPTRDAIVAVLKRRIGWIAERRRLRPNHQSQEDSEEDVEELALIEEMEDFALEDMGRVVEALFSPGMQPDGMGMAGEGQALLVGISSVRELGMANR